MEQNIINPLSGFEPVIGTWLWALQDSRQRTLDLLNGLDDQTVNWIPLDGTNSIGTLLYHIAAIEISWLYEDIFEGTNFPPEIAALMKFDVRDDDGSLTSVFAESLDTHLNRLEYCRNHFLSKLEGMSVEEFRRHRKLEDYDVTPEWVIHHLMQHEAEHRGQIGEIRLMAEDALRRISGE